MTETLETMDEMTLLRVFVDLRDRTLQKNRIAFGNRIAAINGGRDEAGENLVELFTRWFDRFEAMEKEVDGLIREIAGKIEIVQQAVQVKGIGLINVSKVIALIDVERSPTVSSLWRYGGLAVIDGARERPVKGEKLHYNKRLKTAVLLVADSMLKAGSPYREEYDRARDHYETARPEWSGLRKHYSARRCMIKLWLSHLWEAWRELEGLPVRPPYVLERMGHTTFKSRFEYGWPGGDEEEAA